MAHHKYLICVVSDKLELIASFPIVIFFKNFNTIKLIVFACNHTGFVLNMVIAISHKDLVQTVNLIKLLGFVFANYNIAFSIAVDAKVQLALQVLK